MLNRHGVVDKHGYVYGYESSCWISRNIQYGCWYVSIYSRMRFGLLRSSIGQTIIADIFDQRRRGTAVGFFMVGSVLGPAIGPLVGGIIVTFASWRIIFWVQTGMVGLGLVLSLLFVPSIAQPHQITEKPSLKLWGKSQVEMLKVFTLLIYPNVFFAVCSPLTTRRKL